MIEYRAGARRCQGKGLQLTLNSCRNSTQNEVLEGFGIVLLAFFLYFVFLQGAGWCRSEISLASSQSTRSILGQCWGCENINGTIVGSRTY